MDSIVCLIPAYEPDEKLLGVVREGLAAGLRHILIVDDGSGEAYSEIFSEAGALGAEVIGYEENKGKGFALRTGFQHILDAMPGIKGCVTADADGQHTTADILRIANEVIEHPDKLTLGCRGFDTDNVPFKSRLGNSITATIFRLLTGIRCDDTQTGLRGIPVGLLPEALKIEGNRYEYEMNCLMAAAEKEIEFNMIRIETVYIDDNSSSHFRVIRDSFLIYRRPLTFVSISLGCSLMDLILFTVFHELVFARADDMILSSTVLARIISGTMNFTLNKKLTFRASGSTLPQTAKYIVLFMFIMLASGNLVSLLSFLPLPTVVIKIFVDVCLFFVNYTVQKKWVFREKKADEDEFEEI